MPEKSILKILSLLAVTSLFVAAPAAHAAALAHWTFDATTGGDKNIYPDAVGNFPATPENKDLIKVYGGEAPFGKAVALNGQDKSHLNIPFLNGFQRNSFTIAVWVNTGAPGHNFILADWYGPDYSYLFGLDQNKNKTFMIGELRSAMVSSKETSKNKTTPVAKITSTRDIPLNEWHHVAWVWKKTDVTHGTLTAYIDGEERGKKPEINAQEVQNNNRPAKIGYKQDVHASFNGAIDELWVFSDALSQDQVKNIMRYNNLGGTGALAKVLAKKADGAFALVAPAASPPAPPKSMPPVVVVSPPPNPPAVTPAPAPLPGPVAVTPAPVDPIPVAPVTPTPAEITAGTGDAPETTIVTSETDAAPSSPGAVATAPNLISESAGIVAVRRGYTSGRIAGIITCVALLLALSSFLFWAVAERSKMRQNGRA